MEYNYNETDNSQNPSRRGRGFSGRTASLGVLVIAAGILLLANNTGFLDASISRIVFSWEMLLIAIGVFNIIRHQSLWAGAVLIGIGSFFLLVNFYHMPFSTWQLFLPALIILIGLKMIFGKRHSGKHYIKEPFFENVVGSEDFFEDIAIFGGGDRRVVTPNLKGGQLVAIFGGSKINLTHSNIAPGDKPTIEVVCIFGGSTLLVPADWNVRVEVFNIFGGYVDKRIPAQVDTNKTLVVKGVTVFGGGEVKSY